MSRAHSLRLTMRHASGWGAGVGLAILLAGCGSGSPTAAASGTTLDLAVRGLIPLDAATEGSYEMWAVTASGERVSAGRIAAGAITAGGTSHVPLVLPVGGATAIQVTVEPPGDVDAVPSSAVLLAGALHGSSAHLTIEGSVTDGRPLERHPGHHSLFTSSNNVALGYPSAENAGLWLFSISVEVNLHKTREVKLIPLRRGWIYEGWVVRSPGTPDEVWVPYGKYRPDPLGLLTSRDNTGSGFFSGDEDYVNGGVEDVPGDEWTTTRVASKLGLQLPGGLEVPLALDSLDAAGRPVWYHVITIEPAFDESEPPLADRPFALRPYRNAIGAGGPGVPREILYQDNDPTADVRPLP
jgi:Anti-sigma-K factor rskA, C-terminal